MLASYCHRGLHAEACCFAVLTVHLWLCTVCRAGSNRLCLARMLATAASTRTHTQSHITYIYIHMYGTPPETPRLRYLDCTSWSLLPLTSSDCIQCCFTVICFCYVLFTTTLAHDAWGSVECSGWGSHAMMIAVVISDRLQCRTKTE